MFRGTFNHSIDAKGRTSLPARWREELEKASATQLMVTQGPDENLWCFPMGTWLELEAKIMAKPQFDPEVREFVTGFISPAHDCEVDKMGRILIPPPLREYASLEGDVVWAGAVQRGELWSAERWNNRRNAVKPRLASGTFGSGMGI